jgi:hypothetical protein
MKRIILSIASAIAVLALIIGVLPAFTFSNDSENADSVNANYVSNDIEGKDEFIASLLQASSAKKYEYTPYKTQTGEPLLFTLAATDPDHDLLTYSASNLPPGATFDPQTGTFSWTPGYDQAGVYADVHFEVSDGELTDSENITITVVNCNQPPVAETVGDKLTHEEVLLEFEFNAADPDNDPLTYDASNLPPGASFDKATRKFSWKPGFGQSGIYSGVRFGASDGELVTVEEITIVVESSQEAVFSVDSLRVRPGKVTSGKPVSISVIATNTGDTAGSYEVILKINDIVEDTKVVTLAPGITAEVKFTTIKDIDGKYKVDVNGLIDSFLVRDLVKGRKNKIVQVGNFVPEAFNWIQDIIW